MTVELQSNSEQQTQEIAAKLARSLKPGDLIALEGPLGAGKTCFVRGLATGLGIDPSAVSSPTFVICHEYASAESDRGLDLIHVDAYRVRGPEELETIGWNELLITPSAVIAVEWPSRIAAALPEQRIEVNLVHLGKQIRGITVRARPDIEGELRVGEPKAEHACRTCGKPIDPASKTFPFCSPRCRMADLGKWFMGGYRVSRPVKFEDDTEA